MAADHEDPSNATRGVEDFAEEMGESVEDGAWGTEVHAGISGEIGCQAPWTAQEQRVMRGAVLAHSQGRTQVTSAPEG